jgi:hypothetical protein
MVRKDSDMSRRVPGSIRPIFIEEDLDQVTLDQLRAQLGLSPRSRLDDDEDVSFGSRDLREGAGESVWLSLERDYSSRRWSFEIFYRGERPSQEMIEQWRSQIYRAIADAGLHVRKVRHW